ncbi:hypothetical protein [Jiella pelagia]|uniref:Uncharacterized protein n=1 Tax=Jiella pelagia TaxID=2986949 RepID=A0ABY7C7N5_9HYPH|nr:hypothetical protein [Jiella pelagia]WAP70798.1 hypothetical protein OH818_12810 [Jiella pelagia]
MAKNGKIRSASRGAALTLVASAALVLAASGPGAAQTSPSPEQKAAEASSAWSELKPDLFGDREPHRGDRHDRHRGTEAGDRPGHRAGEAQLRPEDGRA